MNSHQRRKARRKNLLARRLKSFLNQDFGKADMVSLPDSIQSLIPRKPGESYPVMWDIQSMRDYVKECEK